ncbi:hypothetical protein OPV22_000218 [Ensete ventricosum]|uniref:MYB-CC type transcription factor LHEQLE-containing domain-containing protein n=1 Tax=Ensete ventricosum TaxID=4639 RepID=A0AAV8RVB5_ENSVE|nr:hypothetical protein OPV22_000218 [Ensete ventricosum]
MVKTGREGERNDYKASAKHDGHEGIDVVPSSEVWTWKANQNGEKPGSKEEREMPLGEGLRYQIEVQRKLQEQLEV